MGDGGGALYGPGALAWQRAAKCWNQLGVAQSFLLWKSL
jgi:hypothetical protein